MTSQVERRWRPGFPCDPPVILSAFRRGPGDPSYQLDGPAVWRCSNTPEGPVTLRVVARTSTGEVLAQGWGAGAEWMLEAVPDLLGAADDPSGFRPTDRVVSNAVRRFPGWRVPRSGLVFETLLPAVLEQKVTGHEAWLGWRRLLRRFGDPAPGPGRERGMRLCPTPGRVLTVPSWEWLRMRVDPARSRTVLQSARVATALERTVGLPGPEVDRRLRSIPGVGAWTSAEVRQRAHGDADAVSFGDYHVARDIGWALTGRECDDEGLAELLEPYRPHRFRVQRLLELSGARRPRRGPRMAPRTHLPG